METKTVSRSDAQTDDVGGDTAHLIVALQCDRPLAPVLRVPLATATAVRIGRGAGSDVTTSGGEVVVTLPDPRLSSRHARLVRAASVWRIEDLGSKNGTLVNSATTKRRVVRDGDLIELGDTFLIFRSASAHLARFEGVLAVDPGQMSALSTLSPALAATFAELRIAAADDRPVLITGETGTGKELTARAVHELSGRRGRFLGINCAAVPETLVESSFFGVQRGAFSGATMTREGWVRSAHGGTLFLDEVAELSDPAQASLLRVLQESEVVPVGGSAPIAIDVRFVAATHQQLDLRMREGLFRQDLYARLTAHHIHLPPLRDRIEDLGLLAACTLRASGASPELTIHRDAARALFAYRWSKNIRELDNALHAAVPLAQGRRIEVQHLPPAMRPAPRPQPVQYQVDLDDPDGLRRTLVELLERHRGNLSAVARALGRERIQIRRWNERFGIDPDEFR